MKAASGTTQTLGNEDLISRAYAIAIEAAQWLMAVWPGLQLRVEYPEDIAGEWISKKGKFIKWPGDDPECISPEWRFRTWIFHAVKRYTLQYIYTTSRERSLSMTPSSTLSLDAPVNQHDLRGIDRLADSTHDYTRDYMEASEVEEALTILESVPFGQNKGDGPIETEHGPMDRNMRTFVELLILGYKKTEVADLFGVSKSHVSMVARDRLPAVLNSVL